MNLEERSLTLLHAEEARGRVEDAPGHLDPVDLLQGGLTASQIVDLISTDQARDSARLDWVQLRSAVVQRSCSGEYEVVAEGRCGPRSPDVRAAIDARMAQDATDVLREALGVPRPPQDPSGTSSRPETSQGH